MDKKKYAGQRQQKKEKVNIHRKIKGTEKETEKEKNNNKKELHGKNTNL